ncbi:MAG: pyruvate formate lyase family protein [Thermodesulfobacteriota bacterium]|nr:pyruvate formate lyase family protein [Thermodesulfobacteriota bacterium]
MPTRTQSLLLDTPLKAVQVGLEELTDEARARRPGFKWMLDLQRAKLLTESYKETEGQPMSLRRAKALAKILAEMKIYIRPSELIVGNYASTLDSVCFYPEFAWKWVIRDTAEGGVYEPLLDDKGREELKEICDYWRETGLSIHHRHRDYIFEDLAEAFWIFNWESTTPNYEKILKTGLKGIIEEAKFRKKRLEKELMAGDVNGVDFVKKKDFLDSVVIALQAVCDWGKRYARLARDTAAAETDPVRKQELETIAGNCESVPENPARTLHEALQCFWFIHLIVNFIELPQVGCGIRFDQCFNSFYEDDSAKGLLDRDQARELVESVFVKFQETGFLHAPMWSGFGGGGLGYQTVTISGTDSQGNDITNEMTYMVLDAVKQLRSINPPLALRWHNEIPKKLVDKSIELLAAGVPQPAFFNDNVNVLRMVQLGAPVEDARNYSINNCMVPTIPGKNFSHRSAWASVTHLPLCLNTALGIGNLAMYYKTGEAVIDPAKVSSIDELIEATIENYKWLVHRLVIMANIADALYQEYTPRPFLSGVLDESIDRAQDCRDWNYEPDYRDIVVTGINNVADSLAAIKKLVFEEKKVTLEELVAALKNNWNGSENLRHMCLAAPKFGNDDDVVDLLSRDIARRILKTTQEFKTNAGRPVIYDGTVATSFWLGGRCCAATPDGRAAGDTFHDGSISPMGNADKKGPTAVLKSVSKVDPLSTANHLFNQTFMPQFVKGPNAELFAQYLKTYADFGIHHIQFSVVDRETLEDAQEHPEKYPDLQVRVAGYAAYFIDLDKYLQDSIISRTNQCFTS